MKDMSESEWQTTCRLGRSDARDLGAVGQRRTALSYLISGTHKTHLRIALLVGHNVPCGKAVWAGGRAVWRVAVPCGGWQCRVGGWQCRVAGGTAVWRVAVPCGRMAAGRAVWAGWHSRVTAPYIIE